MAAIVSDSDVGMAELVGVHGGDGKLGWKRLGTGNMLSTALDSFEIAELPPGSRAGAHVHSRTEELFFVLSGTARIGLGDDVAEVGAGEAILTGWNGLQSVDATGDEPYRMLVIEALPPEVEQALPQHRPTEETPGSDRSPARPSGHGSEPRYRVASLRENGGTLGASVLNEVFHAPWRSVELLHLAAGERCGPRTLDSSEVLVFVTDGYGTARLLSGPVDLRPGTSLTLFKDELLDLTAGEESLEVFVAEMGAGS